MVNMSAKKEFSKRGSCGNYRFRVEIGGVALARFCDVFFPESSNDAVEYSDGVYSPRKQAGSLINKNLILKRGVTASMELYNWHKLVEQGKPSVARRNISVILMDETFRDAARWEFSNAWPIKYEGPDLTAQGNDVAIETIEIVSESWERVQ